MEQPLIILDWDDTVIPTSHLSENHCELEELAAFAEETENFLRTCLKLGQVVLCTNAEFWWPQSSAWTYFPSLCELLGSIPVISAQAEFAPLGYTNPFDWKRLAFEQIVTNYQATNVLSIGDAWYERAAVILACRNLAQTLGQPVCCKSVKFLDVPTLATLTKQQSAMPGMLPRILQHPGCLDIFLPAPDQMHQLLQDSLFDGPSSPEMKRKDSSDAESASTRPSTTTPPVDERKNRRRRRARGRPAARTVDSLPDMPFPEVQA
jgi:hypothetical protein